MVLRSLRLVAYAVSVLCIPVVPEVWGLYKRGKTEGETILLQRYSQGRPRQHRFAQMWSGGGGIRLMYGNHADAEPIGREPKDEPVIRATYSLGPKPYPFNRFDGIAHTWRGFEYFHHDYDNGSGHTRFERSITAPAWAFAAVFLLLPAFTSYRAARRGRIALRTYLRKKNRRCVKCNYDLRESPEKCPECGTPAPKEKERLVPARTQRAEGPQV